MKNILTIGIAKQENSLGLEVCLGMPIWVDKDAPEIKEIETDVRALVKKIGGLVFDGEPMKRTVKTNNEAPKDMDRLESSLEHAKAFGAIAEIIKEVGKDHIDESEQKRLDEMIKMSKIASMLEDVRKDLFK